MHLQSASGRELSECVYVSGGFPKERQQQSQQDIATGSLYSCHSCGYQTRRKDHMENHVRVHTKERPFACRHCGWTFSDPCNQRRHERKHTGACYRCVICFRTFMRKKYLTDHLKTH